MSLLSASLHYNYYRVYDPDLGRYVTSDPIGLAGGFNTYSYAAENPMSFVDPLGLFLTSVDATCAQAPDLCGEIFGQIADNAQAIQNKQSCESGFGDDMYGVGSGLPVAAIGILSVRGSIKSLFKKIGKSKNPTVTNNGNLLGRHLLGDARVENNKLRNIIDDSFRESSRLGGGTAGALRFEQVSGRAFRSKTGHFGKATGQARGLQRLIDSNQLSGFEKFVAIRLRASLRDSATIR